MWEAISANKRKSVFLIILMGILLVLLGGTIGGALFGANDSRGILLGIFIASFIWFIMTLVALFQGRNLLLAVSGAREVKHSDAPQLYNIVEEMRIAASLPAIPKVYIMEEKAPNAFAVGTPENAAVAVTTGLLSVLSRDELQGVIAHEIGHIKNMDTKFMTIAGVMMGTIVILADLYVRGMFYGSLFGGRRRSSNSQGGNNLQLILMIVGIVLAILAPLLAHMLYMACSRSREYLADASAAIFTRYPEGLASALEKIAGSHVKLASANRVTAPMYIINPTMKAHGGGSSLFSTHPPTKERVAILRSMGGAGLNDYNNAYRAALGKDVIGSTSLRSAEELKLRGIVPTATATKVDLKKQTRAATDILHKLNKFLFIPCACGVRIKVPPTFAKEALSCPRCGKKHNLSEAKAAN
jgi:heat shock protein HtpX